MSGVINSVLSFFADYWIWIAGSAAGAGFLIAMVRVIASAPRHRPGPIVARPPATAAAGGPPVGPPPRSTGRAADELEHERRRFQAILADLKEDNERLKDRVAQLTQLNSVFAPLVKELNANVDRRRMGPIVLRVLERLFAPPQALMFLLEEGGEDLVLVAQAGADDLGEGFRLPVGAGFAGVVAKKRVTLTKDDLKHESNLVRQRVQETEPPELSTDVAAPIIHGGDLLGVLLMGGKGAVAEDERSLIGMVADMTALALKNYVQYRKIQELANSDSLTGTCNKGYFLEVANREIAAAAKERRRIAVLMLDLDHFKHYNDTNGHLAGDRLLRELAELLKDLVREQDVVGRFGGEEFIVLLAEVTAEEARQAAERIREAIAGHPFEHAEKQPLGTISASIGIAWAPEHGREAGELIEKADEALYAAKNGGRNRVATPSPSHQTAETVEEVIRF